MWKFNSKCSSFFAIFLLAATATFAQNNNVAQRPFGQQTVSFSATPTFDASKSDAFKMTLTGNVTSSTLTGLEPGMSVTLDIYQDGAGSHTFAPPAIVTGWVAILSSPNAQTTEICYYDGTNCNVYTTTTSGGGGSGTVNSGTAGHYTYYAATGTTVSSNANLDDGVTNANGLTYGGTAGIFAATFNANGTGAMTFIAPESTCSGATIGKDVFCAGDSLSHSIQTSLNGASFFPVPQWTSTSPVPHGVVVAETFPQHVALARGAQGQPFLEGSPTGDPGFGQLDLSISANVINRLAKANQTASTVFNDQANAFTAAGSIDLSASTVAGALRSPNVAGCTVTINGAFCNDTTSNNEHVGLNGVDARIAVWTGSAPTNGNCAKFSNVSGHVEVVDALTTCGGGSSPRLDQVTSATNAWTTTNGDNPLSLQFAPTTASRTSVEITESSAATSTGTPFSLNVHTLATSTANPAQFCAGGTSNCWRVDTSSLLKPLGSAALAVPGTAHTVVVSEGGTAATANVATGNAGQVLISNGSSSDPSFQDPIVSQAFVNLWTAQDITVTRTSSAVRNPIFSQSATLQLTFAGITGSPSGCTLQFRGVDSQGNVLNNGGTVSISPANGTSSSTFTAASTLQTAAQVSAVYACSTYPTAGTLTLDFTPIPNVNVTNTVAVSGTVTTTPPANASTNVAQLAGTATDTNSGNKSAGTLRVVLATDQPQLTNKLLVTPDSVALPAHQSTNVDQLNGTTTDTNSGNKSAGTLRVVLATDQPAMTNAQPVTPQINAGAAAGDTTHRQFVLVYPDTTTTSYHASKNVASAASATDISVLPGNATNTVLVNRVIVSCTQTTAGIITIQLIKRSTADTAGTSSSMTAVPDDANYAAGVSAPLVYTANPTTGTAIGNVDTASVGCMASATASANDIYVFRPAKPIVLRGTAQQLAVNLNSTTVTGGSFNVTYEYEETTTP